MASQSTERFTDRVNDYIRYRPGYPDALMDYLVSKTGLPPGSAVADIGSGTGIFTRQLLERGFNVFAVEPNQAMRAAAEDLLAGYPGFTSVAGSADRTTLGAHTADMIVCAQAFHWFNTAGTKTEFQRILRENSYVALIWNNRVVDADAFSVAYERLLQQSSKDYNEVNHQNLKHSDFESFFRSGQYDLLAFPNVQLFDEEGLTGRAFSSSYVPAADTEAGRLFLADLKAVFRQYQDAGKVRFQYQTEVYLGRV